MDGLSWCPADSRCCHPIKSHFAQMPHRKLRCYNTFSANNLCREHRTTGIHHLHSNVHLKINNGSRQQHFYTSHNCHSLTTHKYWCQGLRPLTQATQGTRPMLTTGTASRTVTQHSKEQSLTLLFSPSLHCCSRTELLRGMQMPPLLQSLISARCTTAHCYNITTDAVMFYHV